jgi:hypothetical protein
VTPPTGPEVELMMKIARLQRELDRDARAFVLRLVLALVVAFSAGFLVGKLWR